MCKNSGMASDNICDTGCDSIHHKQDFALWEIGGDVAVTVRRVGIDHFKLASIDQVGLAFTFPDFSSG